MLTGVVPRSPCFESPAGRGPGSAVTETPTGADEPAGSDEDGIRAALRRHLKERMTARDKAAVRAIRIALAAIENAEAQPIGDSTPTAQLLRASPSTDVDRRVVSDDAARALVAAEVEELRAAARHRHSIGQTEAAETLEHEATVLGAILSSER